MEATVPAAVAHGEGLSPKELSDVDTDGMSDQSEGDDSNSRFDSEAESKDDLENRGTSKSPSVAAGLPASKSITPTTSETRPTKGIEHFGQAARKTFFGVEPRTALTPTRPDKLPWSTWGARAPSTALLDEELDQKLPELPKTPSTLDEEITALFLPAITFDADEEESENQRHRRSREEEQQIYEHLYDGVDEEDIYLSCLAFEELQREAEESAIFPSSGSADDSGGGRLSAASGTTAQAPLAWVSRIKWRPLLGDSYWLRDSPTDEALLTCARTEGRQPVKKSEPKRSFFRAIRGAANTRFRSNPMRDEDDDDTADHFDQRRMVDEFKKYGRVVVESTLPASNSADGDSPVATASCDSDAPAADGTVKASYVLGAAADSRRARLIKRREAAEFARIADSSELASDVFKFNQLKVCSPGQYTQSYPV